MSKPKKKRCKSCRKNKPLNSDNFRKYWSGMGGQYYYHSICRVCEREYQQARRDEIKRLREEQDKKNS